MRSVNESNERCPSILRLDQLLVGELDGAAGERTRAHVEACASCAPRFAALVADRAAFRAAIPPLPVEVVARSTASAPTTRSPAPRHRRFFAVAGMIATAAAAVLVVLAWRRSPDDGHLRTKGADQLGVYVKRDGVVSMLASDDVVFAGDALRLTYTTSAPRYVVVVGRDSAGSIAVYFPDGDQAARVEPGQDIPLPGSIVLDDVGERETFIASFCDTAIDVDVVVRAVRNAAEPTIAGCHVRRVAFVKRALR